jgi:diguanylate cyclase (GGDEF)-like protein
MAGDQSRQEITGHDSPNPCNNPDDERIYPAITEQILIVDDDPLVLEGYRRALSRQFRLDIAGGGQAALDLVEKRGPYAVLVTDMRMPGMNGMELLIRLKAINPNTVRMMLTGNVDQQTAVDAVNQGHVFKFMNKPFAAEAMASALTEALAIYRQQEKRRALLTRNSAAVEELTEKLAYQSRHDTLTGLANRHAFEIRTQALLDSARNEGKTHSLCYIDLDHFHVINDSCGPAVGDEVLRQVGQLLLSQRRQSDLIARLSSDEFGILLSDCPLDMAQQIIERLQTTLGQYRLHWEDTRYGLSVSLGLISITGRDANVAALFSAAETACNVAKDRGCNRLHVGGSEDRELTKRLDEVQWVSRIVQALQENRFHLYYQTIVPVDDKSGQGDHYELLIRMEDEKGAIIPPEAFLPAAENYHLSNQLDRWVISTLIEWLSQQPDKLLRLSHCAINLSGHSVGSQEMLDFIRGAFENSPVPPGKICFEITETAAIARLSDAVRFISTLRADGFRFSLDDFGTGLSSFAYLKNLPVDYLKIDGAFIRQMDSNDIDRAMVKSINEIAHAMGKETIAEFVETAGIEQHLRELGVDYMQGYLFAKPRPLNEME